MGFRYKNSFDPKSMASSGLTEPTFSYNPKSDLPSIQSTATGDVAAEAVEKKGSGISTPEVMAASMALQLADDYLKAPYLEMQKKEANEINRRNKQEASISNLQNISQMYGNL